jgi:NADH dehydrogenase [ubiquinone] 1 alpha subcomplex assembly factor 6
MNASAEYNAAIMNARAPRSNQLSPLAKSLRDGDYDRFLTVLFAPPEKREPLFALLALNLETARVRDVVREPMLGQIRLQWWREALAEVQAGKPRRHDVLEGLAEAGVPPSLLDEMLDAREVELAPEPPETMAEFRTYALGTSGAVSEAMAAILGDHEATRAAARAAGTAFGMIGILRATRFLASRGRVLLPAHLLDECGTSVAAVKDLRAEPGLALAVERIAQAAKEELDRARALRGSVPKALRAAVLLAPLADSYHARLRGAGFDVLNSDLSLSPLRKQFVVGWAAVRGRY